PILPTWRSRITRSGAESATAARTWWPRVSSRTVVEPSRTAAFTSLRNAAESATRRMSGTGAEGSRRPPWVAFPARGGAVSGGAVLNIQVDDRDGYTVCRPVGELDAYTVGQFRDSLGELATKPKLLIDMSDVPFVDSAGLGALIGGIRRAREVGGDVAVCCN